MSRLSQRRRPALRPGDRPPRLTLEALEARCACAAGAVASALAAVGTPVVVPRPPDPPARVGVILGDVPPGAAVTPAVVRAGVIRLDLAAGVPLFDPAGHADVAVARSVDPSAPVGAALPGGPPGTAITPAVVKAEVVHLKLTAGVPYTGPVAHMDADDSTFGADDATHLAVHIDWGNGQATSGVVQVGTGGGYDVVATAAYSSPGDYAVTVQVATADGSMMMTAAGEADVAAAAPSSLEDAPRVPPQVTPAPGPAQADSGGGNFSTAGADAAATRSASRPPADTGGAVPWVRLPDPRPVSPVAPPAGPDRPAVGPVVGPPAPAGDGPRAAGGDPPAVGPAYLAAADDAPAPAADLAPIDVRPEPVAVAAAAPAAAPDAKPADRPTACACAAAMAAGEHGRAADGRPARQCGLWWKSLSWCLALIFTERALASRAADRRPPHLKK